MALRQLGKLADHVGNGFIGMPFSDSYFPDRGPRYWRAERRFQRTLLGGFALVLLLMIASGLVGLYAMRRLGQNTGQMSDRYLAQTHLVDELERQQGEIGILLHDLVQERPGADLGAFLARTEACRQSILALGREVTTQDLRTNERQAWKAIEQSVAPMFQEIDRLIVERRTDSEELSVLHARFITETARLMDIVYDDLRRDRKDELTEETAIIRSSQALLVGSWCVAILLAALSILGLRKLFQTLEQQAETLGRLSVHTLAEQEDTARRFSQEMHDEFGQTLNAIESTLTVVQGRDEVHQARVEDAIQLSKEAQAMAREMSQLLRPRILDDFGLDAGLRELALGFSRRTGIVVDYRGVFRERLDASVETHLFRIAQEALTNTARHTAATQVEVSLLLEDGVLKLRVADNGGGLTGDGSSSSLGLYGMRERARASGGRFTLRSTPGRGVEILVETPLLGNPAAAPGPALSGAMAVKEPA